MTYKVVKLMTSFFLLVASVTTTALGGSAEDWVARQTVRFHEARAGGARNVPVVLSVHRLFPGLDESSGLDRGSAAGYHQLLGEAEALGLIPIVTSTIWVFPAGADAPRVPPTPFLPDARVPEARTNCIPDFESGEYVRLGQVRDSMFAALAREFPEAETWMVGFDGTLSYHDCAGRGLSLEDLVVFAVDSLWGVNRALKGELPQVQVLAHFLGRRSIPISLGRELVQPGETWPESRRRSCAAAVRVKSTSTTGSAQCSRSY